MLEDPTCVNRSDVNAELKKICSGAKLFGRQAEQEKLVECWGRVCRENKQELVVLSGIAGSGKSSLAESLRPLVKEKPKCFFLSGRYVENRQHRVVGDPYEIFETAFSRYVGELMDTKNDLLIDKISGELSDALRGDSSILHMIPALQPLLLYQSNPKSNLRRSSLSSGSVNNDTQHSTEFYSSEGSNQLKYAFENAVSAICRVTPLVLLLDNLHWATSVSMDLLQTLLQSDQSMALLVVTTIRSEYLSCSSAEPSPTAYRMTVLNENMIGPGKRSHDTTPTNHSSSALRSTLKVLQETASLQTTIIDLSNLELSDFRILIADALKKRTDEVVEFSRIAHAETEGNVFRFFQLLRLLVDQGIIIFKNRTWSWDDADLDLDLVKNSTLDLVIRTLKTLPRPVQEALKAASCLGVEVDCSAIDRVLQTPSTPLLQKAEDEGFLIFYPQTGGYVFAHDLIRQAACSLIPEEDLCQFYLNLGRRLRSSSSSTTLEANIMMIASLFNAGSSLVTEERQRYKVAELNLKAAKKALSVTSLPDAAIFLRKGIELLPARCWEDRYELSLQLFSNAAEVHCWMGDFDSVHGYINEVVDHGRCLFDKLPSYAVLIKSMDAQEDQQEALQVCTSVLGELGERLPSKATKLTVLKEFFLVRHALQGKTDYDIKSLKRMTNKSKIYCMNFMNHGFYVSFMAKNPMASVFAFRAIRLTLSWGLHESASVAFSVFAMTLSGLHINEMEGYRFGKLAIELADSANSPRHMILANQIVGFGVLHWTQSSQTSLTTLNNIADIAMRTGFIWSALSAYVLAHSTAILTGSNLLSVKSELAKTVRLTRIHNFPKIHNMGLLLQQVVSCHEGNEADPSRPTGSIINFQETVTEFLGLHDSTIVVMYYFMGAYLACFYGNYVESKSFAILLEKMQRGPAPAFMMSQFPFVFSLSAVNLCRSGIDEAKNRSLAKKHFKTVGKYAKKCPCNFLSLRLLLEGELLSLERHGNSEDQVSKLYRQARNCAEEQNNHAIVGMALEKHGDYLASLGKTAEAVSLWTEAAKEGFDKMGAVAKSQQIRNRALHHEGGTVP